VLAPSQDRNCHDQEKQHKILQFILTSLIGMHRGLQTDGTVNSYSDSGGKNVTKQPPRFADKYVSELTYPNLLIRTPTDSRPAPDRFVETIKTSSEKMQGARRNPHKGATKSCSTPAGKSRKFPD
jgi:hypothetical protein